MRNTLERNGEPVIKNTGTGGKRFANRWETIRKQVRNDSQTGEKSWANLLRKRN